MGRLSREVRIWQSRIRDALGMLEAAQIRAARALLGWRQDDLSKASGVGTATIRRIENSGSPITGYVSTVMRIQAAFEKAGILFIAGDEIAGIGVRLAKKKRGR
jgi:transcriptional regulator with XRE-family HTH domain